MKMTNGYFRLLFITLLFYSITLNSFNSFAKFISITSTPLKIYQEPEILHAGAYLIIGVFQDVNNARQFAESAIQEGLNAHYKYYQLNQLIYVYTHSDNTKNSILPEYYQIRETTRYKDAWILSVQDNVSSDVLTPTTSYDSSQQNVGDEHSPLVTEKSIPNQSETITVIFQPVDTIKEDTTVVSAQIQVVDGNQAKLIEQTDTERGWTFTPKALSLDTVQVITEAIGYRKNQVSLSINELLRDTNNSNNVLLQDTLFVQLEMKSLEVGDYQVMYNTYFYGNSTVMRAHSKYELEIVYNILKSNPDMRIRLHGHTNGNSRGVAYLYKEEKQNFFEIIRTKAYRKRGVSSTKLSHYRAETIKSYLVSQGIGDKRIETQGWGGKKMLYDEESPMATNNIRVEIEVLSK